MKFDTCGRDINCEEIKSLLEQELKECNFKLEKFGKGHLIKVKKSACIGAHVFLENQKINVNPNFGSTFISYLIFYCGGLIAYAFIYPKQREFAKEIMRIVKEVYE